MIFLINKKKYQLLKKAPHWYERLSAVRTRLELATPGVTGRYSNHLNYRTSIEE